MAKAKLTRRRLEGRVQYLQGLVKMLMILLVVLLVLVAWNMVKIHQYRDISTGDYITRQECVNMYSEAYGFDNVNNVTVRVNGFGT